MKSHRIGILVVLALILAVPVGVKAASVGYHVPVLMYHRITCPAPDAELPDLWVCPARLDRTLGLLKSQGWKTITAKNLFWKVKSGLAIPPETFVITFDDGSRDGYDSAFPILEKYGFVGVFGVVVSRVNRFILRNNMSWVELNELEDAGHEIANHSMDHDSLSAESQSGLIWEVETSSQILADNLGARPKTLIYPFGSWDQQAIDQVKASGFRSAFTTAYACSQIWTSRFKAPRIRISGSDSPSQVLAKVGLCA